MTTKFKLVKVSGHGVQFGNAWYSHESITGYSADQLNQGNFCVTGGAYMKWLSEEATPQPIYDEAKERELFEAYCAKVGLPLDTLPSGEYLIPVTRFVSQGWHARAKAGEVDHE